MRPKFLGRPFMVRKTPRRRSDMNMKTVMMKIYLKPRRRKGSLNRMSKLAPTKERKFPPKNHPEALQKIVKERTKSKVTNSKEKRVQAKKIKSSQPSKFKENLNV